MKTKKHIYTVLIITLLIVIILFKKIQKDPFSVILALGDFFFLVGLFISSLTNTEGKKKLYRRSFIAFVILSFINQGIIQNIGGRNVNQLGFDIIVKIISFFIIFKYLKNEKNK